MKKIISLLICIALLLLCVCGCNDDNPSSSEAPVSSNTSTENVSSDDVPSEDVSSEEVSTDDSVVEPGDGESYEQSYPENNNTSQNSSESDEKEEEKELSVAERMRGGINFSCIETSVNKDKSLYVYNSEYYEIIAKAGFDHVRLPVSFGYIIVGDAPEYILDVEALRCVDMAIDAALDAGLIVVLDNHHGSRYQEKDVFIRTWEQIAERYQNYPEELIFELVNEPTAGADYLNKLQMETVSIIRKTNPNRIIALAADQYNSPSKLWSVEFPKNDDNIIVSIHHYSPLPFLRQGKNWGGSNYPAGVKYTASVQEAASEYLELCADYEKRTGRTVWISEWGAYLNGGMDHADAAKYYEFFTKECARLGLSYAYWEFNSGFGIYDMDKKEWKSHLFDKMTITW